MNWQPIATVPEQKLVIVGAPGKMVTLAKRVRVGRGAGYLTWHRTGGFLLNYEPEGWMPIPDFPREVKPS